MANSYCLQTIVVIAIISKLSLAELTYGDAECPSKEDAEKSKLLVRANGKQCYKFNIFPNEEEQKKQRVMDKFIPECSTDLNCSSE
ncbi:hypothetical protein CSKR_203852 [Clonorchis sinensis]|uniref:Uncharacterized protein n=1 Tax=Clonorchis sinensis TaxID=79923 RepID=A0A8T1N3A2_CLOSI|nr:hypothetical protein CSKR_203852 [Clonorchis sinensis]